MNKTLEGIRVLDLTHMLSGPFAAKSRGSDYGRPNRDLGPFRPSVAPTLLNPCTLNVPELWQRK